MNTELAEVPASQSPAEINPMAHHRGVRHELSGKQFGRLTVIGFVGRDKHSNALWECKCSCGNKSIVKSANLVIGRSASHRMSGSSEYTIWSQMIQRCTNENDVSYCRYGGRGITVCGEWINNFSAFLQHIGCRPSPDHSVDRIDNDKGYEPGNVRWATRSEQQRNRRDSRILTFRGESLLVVEWAAKIGMSYSGLRARLKRLPLEIALTETIAQRGTRK